MRFASKRVIVTGASRGIGRATALRFAEEGATVLLTARDVEALAESAAALTAAGGRALTMAWDLRVVPEIPAKLAEAVALLGGMDILVNNAGVVRLADATPEEQWDYIMDINLKSLLFLSQAAAELMKEQGGGIMVNLSSDAGFRGATSAYCLSKWGVVGLTKGFAQQYAEHGVRINGVAPGPVATRMMGCEDGVPKEAALPLGRYSLPEEIASVVLFLASEDARAIYGETIVVNSANQ